MLQLFRFESKEVHCYGTWDNPIWIAQQVCDCLDLQGDAGQHVRRLDEDEKVLISIQTHGGIQDVLGVTEPGLYSLVLGCRKLIAKRFKRWITHDVIPSIRKTGGYQIESVAPLPSSAVDITIANAKAVAQFMKQAGVADEIADSLVLDAVANQFPELKGMTETGKRLLSAQKPLESVGLTPTEIGERLEPPANAKTVNAALEALGLQERGTRQSTKTGKDKHFWRLTENGKRYGHVYMTTGGNNWSGGQIRWQESVLRLIEAHLAEERDREQE